MTSEEEKEVLGIVRRTGPILLSTPVNPQTGPVVALRRGVGMMMVDPNMVHLPTMAFAMSVCLDLARHSGATLVTMDRVRKAMLEEKPKTLPGVLTVDTIVRLTLASEARIIAYMQFRSRDEVELIANAVNAAFRQSEEVASDNLDSGTYVALIMLHGHVVKHLSDRGRKTPRVITYDYQAVMPALRMAQLAYADAKRFNELIDENHVVHPAFMPKEGKMLAV